MKKPDKKDKVYCQFMQEEFDAYADGYNQAIDEMNYWLKEAVLSPEELEQIQLSALNNFIYGVIPDTQHRAMLISLLYEAISEIHTKQLERLEIQ